MSPTRRRRRPLRLHWAVVLMPRQRRLCLCGMPFIIQFDAVIVVVVVVVVIQGLDILCCGHCHLSRCAAASLVAPPPLSPRRRHYRRANACLIAPLSRQRLVVAPSPLLPRQSQHLSRCTATSLVVPPPLLWLLTCAGWLSLHQLS
jgi:hypothetical protein